MKLLLIPKCPSLSHLGGREHLRRSHWASFLCPAISTVGREEGRQGVPPGSGWRGSPVSAPGHQQGTETGTGLESNIQDQERPWA